MAVVLRGEFGAMRHGMFGNLDIYALTSFNAHNFWWLLTWGQGSRPDTVVAFAGLDYRLFGRLLFLVIALPASVPDARHR